MKKLSLILILFLAMVSGSFSQGLYDINTINTIEITFVESNWDYLLDQLYAAGDEDRLVGSVTINGQQFDSVGIRYKGNSTYNANQIKNPLNVKLDHIIDDQLFEDYGTLKLANVKNDPSFVRETMSYEIARKYMPAGQSNYANVYINDTHLGFYTSDQDVDKFFMRTHFKSDENVRVKGDLAKSLPPSEMGGVWEYFGADSSSYYNLYDMKSDFGWKELVEFLDILNNNQDDVDQVLNIDRHLWFLAFSNLLVNLDGPVNNPQNYYLYQDDAGRFNPIIWDLNESFGVFSMLQNGGPQNTQQLQQLDPFLNLYSADYPNISKVLSNDTYRKIYVAHMKTIMAENFENGWYETRAFEIQDIIAADVQADPNKFYTYSNFINNVNSSVGGGPNSIVGITQLMEARIDYLNSLNDFEYTAPTIVSATHSPEQPASNSEVWFSTEVEDASEVKLAYRSNANAAFTQIIMFDDGNHNDGSAGDGVYGVSIEVGSTDLQYFIYAINADAASFLPARAEYEFFEISITGNLVINEFMADNESTVADQDGDYDDWIEFYNNSSEAINLGGYYLTDDATEPDLWMFPDTSIAAGSYLIVWADKDDEQEGLHADLKLSASGETILLSDMDLKLVDQVSFLQQAPDTSYGRYPNGTGDFGVMLPTFEAENIDSLTAIEDQDVLSFSLEQNYPNPFATTTTIGFMLEKANEVSLKIYNIQGELVTVLVEDYLTNGKYSYQWQPGRQAAGIYFYSITVGQKSLVKKMAVQP
jgi:CotH kinase protein/Lamin Tail Domain/Secretion system C-terminal sorting domain